MALGTCAKGSWREDLGSDGWGGRSRFLVHSRLTANAANAGNFLKNTPVFLGIYVLAVSADWRRSCGFAYLEPVAHQEPFLYDFPGKKTLGGPIG